MAIKANKIRLAGNYVIIHYGDDITQAYRASLINEFECKIDKNYDLAELIIQFGNHQVIVKDTIEQIKDFVSHLILR